MIISRAFVRELLQTSGAVTLVMLSIFLVVRVVGFLRDAAEGDIPVDSVLELLVLKMITYMDVLLPLVFYVSMLLVLGRWSRDNELAVLESSGIGIHRFLRPALGAALVVALLVASFSLYLSPLAVRVFETIRYEFQNRTEVTGIIPGVFTETRHGSGVYFVEEFDGQADRYRNIFVYAGSFDREGIVVAESGFSRVDARTNDQFLILKNGTRYEGNPGTPEYAVVEFDTYAIRLQDRAKKEIAIPVSGIETQYLFKRKHHRIVAERHWRLAKPITVLTLVLFALALSQVDSRRSRVPAMLMAFLVYFGYTNLVGLVTAMMNKGRIHPEIGLWSVHGVFLLLGIALFVRRARNRPLLPRFAGRPLPAAP